MLGWNACSPVSCGGASSSYWCRQSLSHSRDGMASSCWERKEKCDSEGQSRTFPHNPNPTAYNELFPVYLVTHLTHSPATQVTLLNTHPVQQVVCFTSHLGHPVTYYTHCDPFSHLLYYCPPHKVTHFTYSPVPPAPVSNSTKLYSPQGASGPSISYHNYC